MYLNIGQKRSTKKELIDGAAGLIRDRHRGGMSLEQVRGVIRASSHSAVAMQEGRLQRQSPENAQLQRRLKAVAKRLNVQC